MKPTRLNVDSTQTQSISSLHIRLLRLSILFSSICPFNTIQRQTGSCACVCAFFYFCWLVEISTDSIHLHQGQTFFLLEMTNSHYSHLFSPPLIFDSLYSLNIQNILSVFLSPQLSSYSKANSVFAAYTYLSPLYVWNTSHSCWRFLNYQFSLISNLTDSHSCTSLQVDCKKSAW